MNSGADLRMSSRLFRIACASILLVIVGTPAISATSEADRDRKYRFDIPAMVAKDGLMRFAFETETPLLAPLDLLSDKQTNRLAGDYTPAEGLFRLLEGTGLIGTINGGFISVHPAPQVADVPPRGVGGPDIHREKGGNEMQHQEAGDSAVGRRSGLLGSIGAVFAALVTGGDASAAPAAESTGKFIEEIVVTAEKREERILDVPITMTGFNDELLEELGMTRKDDLEQLVPGLQFGETHQKKGQGIVIRGMGNRESGVMQGNMAVATYVDGVYHTQLIGVADGLFDVGRVEVARGPQGTLNGRNSIAGSISIHSQRPTFDWDSTVLAEFTDQFSQRYGLAFGGPVLEDQLAFRLTGTWHDGDGAQENVGTGPDNDAPHSWTLRPQLRFKTDRLDANLKFEKLEDTGRSRTLLLLGQPPTDSNTMCFSWRDPLDPRADDPDDPLFICNEEMNNFAWFMYEKPVPTVVNCAPGALASRCAGDLENKVLANRPAKEDTVRDTWSLNVDFDLSENLTLSYSYGQTELQQFGSNDNDFTDRVPSSQDNATPQDCIDRLGLAECQALFPWGTSDGRSAFPYSNDERSHELLLTSNFEGPFNFIVGAYDYEGDTRWSDAFQGFGHSWRFANSDQRAQALGYADCQDFLTTVIQPQIDDLFGEALEEGRQIICPPGGQSDFTTTGGSAAASTQETQALFASFDYRFNERWAVSGGLRYTEDTNVQTEESDFGFEVTCPPGDADCVANNAGVILQSFWNGLEVNERPPEAPAGCTLNCVGLKQEWDKVIWNVALEFTPRENLMWYGRVSTGYRAGGLPSPTGGFFPPVEEETVINYEGGMKGLFLENRLQLMVGAYLNDYDGYQVNSIRDAVQAGFPQAVGEFSSSPLVEFMTNVDGTSIWGLDVEWTWYLDENWRVSGYYAYLDSELGPFTTIVQNDPNPEVGTWEHLDWDTGEPVTSVYLKPKEIKGATLPQSPKHKGAVTLTYETPIQQPAGQLQLLGTWSYTGDRYALIQNAPSNRMEAYDRLDLRASWTSADQQWTTTVYVQNALDDIGLAEYIPGFRPDWAFNAAEMLPQGLLTEPRQYGLQVRWRPKM
jgi:outer membrane receptor protein involved in Fe transport